MFEEILEKLRTIKIKRFRDPYRPTRRKEDIDKLLELNESLSTSRASKDLNRILILTAFYTGMRVSEIVKLKLEDICL
jgi:integrase